MLQALPRSPKPHALSPEPLQRARSLRPSTGGSLPSASAGAAGASGGLCLPAAGLTKMLVSGAGWGSLSIPQRGGLVPGLPTQRLCSCPVSWGPRFPWEEPNTGAPVPSCLEGCSHSPSPGLSCGGRAAPGLTLGGSSSCGAGFENKREFLRTGVDCSNRERSMNISLRWFKLSNITKPSVLAGI